MGGWRIEDGMQIKISCANSETYCLLIILYSNMVFEKEDHEVIPI